MKTAYTYTVLRYVHDVAAGEFLNVGVVLQAPASRYLGASILGNIGRLRKAFPALHGESHRQLMRYLQERFDQMQVKMVEELAYEPTPEDALAVANTVLPKDDSSLQWSPLGSGLTSDPAAELRRLYLRLVTANDEARANGGRNDDVIWAVYRESLGREKVLPYLNSHKVVAENDEKEFDHAWKNHIWHCLEPLSFDYLDAEAIKAKAHRLLGQIYGVQSAVTNHQLYLMVGEPQLEKCKATAEKCLNLLYKGLPIKTQIVRESEAENFSRDFAQKIRDHAQIQVI